jgi:lipid II:glycine glycyltransferase (peptidoglycan interpeptide bridge formation enzyme)
MDIACDLDDIRKGFDRKWRNQLTKAEKAGLTITSGSSLELIDEFALVYQEMLQRKQFVPSADLQRHRSIQTLLPPDLQMGIVLARHEGRPCAGAIYSALGDTAVYLFGATNDSGMRTCGSYLVQWEVLKLLKERATTYYDLHGINPEANPGTYHFKQGLAGKRGRQVTFVGQFQAFQPSIVNSALLLGGRLRQQARTSRAGLSNGRPNPRTETSTSPGSKAALPSSEADAP